MFRAGVWRRHPAAQSQHSAANSIDGDPTPRLAAIWQDSSGELYQ
jgi:hypothetical protein